MVNVRFKKTCISEYSVYFDVNGRNINRVFEGLEFTGRDAAAFSVDASANFGLPWHHALSDPFTTKLSTMAACAGIGLLSQTRPEKVRATVASMIRPADCMTTRFLL